MKMDHIREPVETAEDTIALAKSHGMPGKELAKMRTSLEEDKDPLRIREMVKKVIRRITSMGRGSRSSAPTIPSTDTGGTD